MEVLVGRQMLAGKYQRQMLGQGRRQRVAGRVVERVGEVDAGDFGADRRVQFADGEFGHCVSSLLCRGGQSSIRSR